MRILTLLLALLALTAPLRANPYADMVRIETLQGGAMPDGSHMVALRLRLAEGWKTYWRAPGDAGIPPSFDWSGSENVQSVTPHWPAPIVFWQSGMRSVGFDRELVLPLQLRPAEAGVAMRLQGEIQMGICKDICVPVTLDLSVNVDLTGPRDPAIDRALAARPLGQAKAGVSQVSCTLRPGKSGLVIEARFTLPRAEAVEAVVIETTDPQVWVAEETVTREGRAITARSELVHVRGGAFAVDRSGLRLTALGQGLAVDIQGCPAP